VLSEKKNPSPPYPPLPTRYPLAPCFLPENPRNCYFYLRQGLTKWERVWYHSRRMDWTGSTDTSEACYSISEVNYDCQCQTV
jgi:hypothetical protein